jgi:SnoaL-like domain
MQHPSCLPIVQKYYAEVDKGVVDEVVGLFEVDAEYSRPAYAHMNGREAIRSFYADDRMIESGVHNSESIVSDSKTVAVEGSFKGTVRGAGPNGLIRNGVRISTRASLDPTGLDKGSKMSVNQESDLVSDVFRIDVSPSRLSNGERAKILANPGFGRFFSDHMSIIYWDANKGWHEACTTELRPFTLHLRVCCAPLRSGSLRGLES